MTGQEAYERDLKRQPTYHDGTIRKTWDQLSDLMRESWNRNPRVRNHGLRIIPHA